MPPNYLPLPLKTALSNVVSILAEPFPAFLLCPYFIFTSHLPFLDAGLGETEGLGDGCPLERRNLRMRSFSA